MAQIEKTTSSFVIRIWLEDHQQGGNPDCWRGHITNVISRERRYVKSLAEITAFLSSHLENMGACPEE
ncbi:MAG: hypothetical protein IPK16_14740 [Anaerolineales bacterium]|nr:hypothetical protein [Anaerolineales bacterium]